MQLLIAIDNGAPVGAPLTADNLRLLLPHLPQRYLQAADLEGTGYAGFMPTPAPANDNPLLRTIEETPTEQNGDGEWLQRWAIVERDDLAEEERSALAAQQMQGLRQAAHARIEAWRDAQERAPIVFEHAGHAWDGGLATRQRLQPVVALAALPQGFFWTDADNVDVPVTIEQLHALNTAHEAAIVLRGFEIHAAQRAMKAALESLPLEELRAFDPGAVWPA